jgi:hypothetical protein
MNANHVLYDHPIFGWLIYSKLNKSSNLYDFHSSKILKELKKNPIYSIK